MVGSSRARCSAVGLAAFDAPPDHVGDSDGLDPTVRGELESTGMGRIDPHRDARPSVLYEELARRVRVNPQAATGGEVRSPGVNRPLKNYLRCRYSVKNRLKMLIYNT